MGKVLVTGAAGFIGSHLVDALVARGDAVRGLDNFATGRRENLSQSMQRIDFITGSLLEEDKLRRACDGVEVIFHQAALPSATRSVKDPRNSHLANIDGTFALLEAARAAGVRRVLFAASSSAYGNQPGLPRLETMLPQPLAPYPVQKVAGELYMQSYYRVYGLETICLRYFNVFGPRQIPDTPFSGVVAKWISQRIRGERPVIFGDGQTGRDFTYVDNAVAANLLASEAAAEQVAGRIFNIACGERHTLQKVDDLMRAALGGEPALRAPERVGDVRDSMAGIGAARAAFGYEPVVDLAEGVRRSIAWYVGEHAR